MRASVRCAILLQAVAGLGAAPLWAADPPYVGTWKLNPARSDFGETTVTYEPIADGQMKVTTGGQSYTFKADGKEYPTPWGNTIAWKTVDANTWEVTTRTNGKVVSTATLKVAGDGKTLTSDARNVLATGQTSDDSSVYTRLSGTSGLAGKWKTKNVKIGSPGTVRITASGPAAVTVMFVEEKGTCDARFDGKDHPATGPIWPSGWTCAVAKDGTSAFGVTWKKDGKPMFKDTFTASADGRTLTDAGGMVGTTERVKAVYDRQ